MRHAAGSRCRARNSLDGEATVGSAGCSAAWLARLLWEQEAAGSNPAIPTSPDLLSGQLRSSLDKSYLSSAAGFLSWVGGIWEISLPRASRSGLTWDIPVTWTFWVHGFACRRLSDAASGSAGA